MSSRKALKKRRRVSEEKNIVCELCKNSVVENECKRCEGKDGKCGLLTCDDCHHLCWCQKYKCFDCYKKESDGCRPNGKCESNDCENSGCLKRECERCNKYVCEDCWKPVFHSCRKCKHKIIDGWVNDPDLGEMTIYCEICTCLDGKDEAKRRHDKYYGMPDFGENRHDVPRLWRKCVNRCKKCGSIACHKCMHPDMYRRCKPCRRKKKRKIDSSRHMIELGEDDISEGFRGTIISWWSDHPKVIKSNYRSIGAHYVLESQHKRLFAPVNQVDDEVLEALHYIDQHKLEKDVDLKEKRRFVEEKCFDYYCGALRTPDDNVVTFDGMRPLFPWRFATMDSTGRCYDEDVVIKRTFQLR